MGDDLREKVAQVIREVRERCEGFALGVAGPLKGDPEVADAILAIPEIRDALAIAGGLRIVDRTHRVNPASHTKAPD